MADDFSQIAKDFIDRANGGTGPTGTWRLEVLQKRFSSKVGREIPIRIRRFLKGIPWAHVHDAIRYLISQSPYTGIIYNGVELKGEYRPTLTQWRRDDQEQVGGNAQGSYTLIQDLIEVTDGDKLDTVSADSCSETEMTKWVWDAPEIEELPYDGGQGVTYAIRQVRRNEDGTFDYAIVKQVAKTKFSGWIVTECDEYSRVSVQVFDNVYGGLSDGDPFTDGTTVLPIPAPCETNDGTLVQVSVAKNPDCTFRVTVQKTEANPNVEKSSETRKGLRGVVTSETTVATNPLPETGLELGEQVRNERRPDGLYDVTHVKVSRESVGDIGSSCETTVFEHRHVESENVASRPEKEASLAGGGKTYQVQSRATEEGTWDVTRTETTEIKQTGAQKTKQKTLRGVTETTVDRNVDNNDITVTNIGDRISVEMTPGGKYNRTVTKVAKESVGDIGSNCERTVFQHTHVESENVASRPEKEANSAGGGKTYQVQARATEEGTWDVTRTETTEIKQTGAQKTKQKTLRGVTETTVDRNVDNNDVTVTNIGDRVSVEMTPGGKYNRTVTKVLKESVGDVGSSCEKTVFEHRHVENENVVKRPEKEANSAGGGKTYQVQARATEEGTWDVSRTTVEEANDVTAQHVMRKTLRGVTETTVTRSTSNSSVSVSEIGDEVRVEQTPGGLWNRTVTHASREAVGVVGKSCSSTPVVHTDTTVSNVPNGSQPEPFHQTAAVNVERTVETRRTEEGTWDVTDKTEVFSEAVATSETKWATETVRVTTRHHDIVKDRTVEGAFGETSSTPDDRGAANTTVVEYVPISADSGWIEWDSEVKSPSSVLKYRCGYRVFKNMEKPPPPGVGASDVDLNVSINRYGLYDGTIAYKKLVSWVRDGSGGGSGGIGTQTGWRRTGRYRPTENQYEWEQREVKVYEGSGNLSASTYAAEAKDSQVSGGGGYTVFTRVLQVKWGNKDSP